AKGCACDSSPPPDGLAYAGFEIRNGQPVDSAAKRVHTLRIGADSHFRCHRVLALPVPGGPQVADGRSIQEQDSLFPDRVLKRSGEPHSDALDLTARLAGDHEAAAGASDVIDHRNQV